MVHNNSSFGTDSVLDDRHVRERLAQRGRPSARQFGVPVVWLALDPDLMPLAFFAGHAEAAGNVWLVRGELIPEARAGTVRVARLVVEAWHHDGEVTGTVLRQLPIGRIRDEAIALLRDLTEPQEWEMRSTSDYPEPDFLWEHPENQMALRSDTRRRRPGRPRLPDSHHEDFALDVLALAERGITPLLPALAKKRGVPLPTVRQWLKQARKMGFLAPGHRGRRDFRPGPRLTNRRPSTNRLPGPSRTAT